MKCFTSLFKCCVANLNVLYVVDLSRVIAYILM
ncbi:hypothetical protein HMPREF1173_02477 [Prevotella nigrescens CC14M]|uniref:Uncharacterized protein n=1 Tax=Prevotella nigrescens CC14M TaxID=1073366 RepID=V8CAN6_9BACT|nr:hypothetical protein HMPREF0662_00186 [Prevotella nigrescens F0103]ETD24424.1 hypothetical protein HMPREF1173_02477 [Prevotella nigrescens CC14M]